MGDDAEVVGEGFVELLPLARECPSKNALVASGRYS